MTEEKNLRLEEWNKEFDGLVGEMYIARRSTLTDETRNRYHGLFEQVQTKSIASELLQSLRALLVLDSRQKLPIGARAGAIASYRLHYRTEQAEIELFVESQIQSCKIEGEVFAKDDGVITPALIELQIPDSYETIHETMTSEEGRFTLENVDRSSYTMFITPAQEDVIEVALELT